MPLQLKNTRELLSPDRFKLKVLLYSLHGGGKTTFLSTVNDSPGNKIVVGACETGHGNGQLSVAKAGIDYFELNSYNDFDEFCSGVGSQNFTAMGLDSLSWANKSFVKDKALSIPRARGESQKRQLGVPELDDYGTMGELSRKLVQKLINQPKHILVTAGLKIDKADPENGQAETLIGPDLPGAMFLGSTAMFDLVLCLRHRSVLRDPKDAKSRYIERYFLTENQGSFLAKNRLSVSDKGISFLPSEVVFDKDKNIGTFDWFLKQATDAYTKFLAEQKAAA